MKLLVGLGNPGLEYQGSRHNLGFEVVDRIARRIAPQSVAKSKFHGLLIETEVGGEKTLLLRPTTYMNLSGTSVSEAVSFYKLNPKEDLLVITDDVALPVGAIRLRASGSAGGHNGLSDIETRIGTDAYARLRVGIGSPPPGTQQKHYVLGFPSKAEREQLEPAIEDAVQASLCWAREGVTAAMNRFNKRGVGAATIEASSQSSTRD